jgi:hypothetical protein
MSLLILDTAECRAMRRMLQWYSNHPPGRLVGGRFHKRPSEVQASQTNGLPNIRVKRNARPNKQPRHRPSAARQVKAQSSRDMNTAMAAVETGALMGRIAQL